jgi:hypothetical protein
MRARTIDMINVYDNDDEMMHACMRGAILTQSLSRSLSHLVTKYTYIATQSDKANEITALLAEYHDYYPS